jgi:hypothetical protein
VKRLAQSIQIAASPQSVERCFTQLDQLHRWLNPLLRVVPQGDWSTEQGADCQFRLQIPLLEPCLQCQVVERDLGLIVWQFKGFFTGRDTWHWQENSAGCYLENCFEFEIPNPLVRLGFDVFAARLTQADMHKQLERLKQVAENPIA